MLIRSRARAKKLGLEFNISIEDIQLLKYCPILNVKLDYLIKKLNNNNAASLDRIDNSKGYVKGNVWVISFQANRMKNTATLDELIIFAKNINSIMFK